MTTLEERIRSLEERVKRFEDLEAIHRLKHLYCRYADVRNGQNHPDQFSRLFTEDAIWEVGEEYRGRQAIAAANRDRVAPWQVAIHLVMDPLIEVHGDTATGMWYGLFPLMSFKGHRIIWQCCRYDEIYVRTPQGWLFRSVKAIYALRGDEEGPIVF